MKPYTVLLLRPEYASDDYGKDTYLDWVLAESVEDAGRQAQENAARVDEQINCEEDYFILAIFDGHLVDQSGHD